MSGTLTISDRCDRCSAAAKVRVGFSGGGVLDFCGHHYRKNQDALNTANANILVESGESFVMGTARTEGDVLDHATPQSHGA